jgi:hypothetical protein
MDKEETMILVVALGLGAASAALAAGLRSPLAGS